MGLSRGETREILMHTKICVFSEEDMLKYQYGLYKLKYQCGLYKLKYQYGL